MDFPSKWGHIVKKINKPCLQVKMKCMIVTHVYVGPIGVVLDD